MEFRGDFQDNLDKLDDEEREQSAELVNSAIEGVQASYGEIYEDAEWPGSGRWTAPEHPVKTDVYEWPLPQGMSNNALDLFARAPRQDMLLRQRRLAVQGRNRLPALYFVQ